ncbi:hypothetical protein KIPB_013196 [Kipferlia bialata]|uniref:Uncharacterized protein n=1 Tax=Kipferlia bialata TaxID=797122 RepID=A0A391NS56_9EUKA|nr:hypothetical protein KIPB_013196 [Kipferlia bialata]|eukprot:g13196.t1
MNVLYDHSLDDLRAWFKELRNPKYTVFEVMLSALPGGVFVVMCLIRVYCYKDKHTYAKYPAFYDDKDGATYSDISTISMLFSEDKHGPALFFCLLAGFDMFRYYLSVVQDITAATRDWRWARVARNTDHSTSDLRAEFTDFALHYEILPMLCFQMLKAMVTVFIFTHNTTVDDADGKDPQQTVHMVWVIILGVIHVWAVYYSLSTRMRARATMCGYSVWSLRQALCSLTWQKIRWVAWFGAGFKAISVCKPVNMMTQLVCVLCESVTFGMLTKLDRTRHPLDWEGKEMAGTNLPTGKEAGGIDGAGYRYPWVLASSLPAGAIRLTFDPYGPPLDYGKRQVYVREMTARTPYPEEDPFDKAQREAAGQPVFAIPFSAFPMPDCTQEMNIEAEGVADTVDAE